MNQTRDNATPPDEFEALRLNLRGLGRIYLSTWPYILPQLRHFLALLALNLGMIGFATAVGFMSFDILWDSVGSREPLSQAQAAVMFLPVADYVLVASLTDNARMEILFRFLVVAGGIIIMTTSAFTLISVYKTWILQRVNQALRVDMVRNAEELSLRFHATTSAGDGIYRVFQDSAMVTAVVDNVVVQPIIAIMTLMLQLTIAVLFSPWFAFLLCVASGIVIALTIWYTPRLRTWSQAARRSNAALFTRVQETFQSVQAIKAYQFERTNLARFEQESLLALDNAFRLRRDFATVKVVASFLLAVTLFATDYVATQFVLREDMVFGASLLVLLGMTVTGWTVAAHQARRGAVAAFTFSFENLVRLWCYAQDMAVGLGRAFWLLSQQPEVRDPADPIAFPEGVDSVKFESVSFGYEPERLVLNGFDLTAQVGQVTALVGTSGAGKSTAMALLLRLFDPDAGSVQINGISLSRMRVNDIRSAVAIALQENVLFPISIADNLRYTTPSATDEEIRDAAAVACALEFIEALPNGFETELGVGGALLSVGQKQRLSIARTLSRNAPILVLDEPTSSLDAETEQRLLANLKDWAHGRVVFVITHRMSTIKDVDHIAFLAEGKVVEAGSHEELMNRQGRYADFVATAETTHV
ncbi:MAG: ABC transporter ATP-binding protein [Gammaproteobacteria bacterium]|nr:ABC transporter ATP-binding protein [Gammaproteobacteria bacterium]